MDDINRDTRRNFLFGLAAAGTGLTLIPNLIHAKTEVKKDKNEIGAVEDLMREHGGLNRVLLIYEEGIKRLNSRKDFDLSILKQSAEIIKTFIENYHEKLEEEYIFPKMRKEKKLVALVDTLEIQHKAGRQLTIVIEKLSIQSSLKNESDKIKLKNTLESFIKMYRPHESREDTVLFPEFHESMTEKEYDKMGDLFEDREQKLFGKDGFNLILHQIEALEKSFDIYDLNLFTPMLPVS